jgi:RNA polymerase sigma-54 factor
MKQSLQLNIGQRLTMTPQLQQAIRLLQLSTLELQQEIQQALDSNMMLEVAEDDIVSLENSSGGDNADKPEPTSEGSQRDIPDELPVDTSWDDIYDTVLPTLGSSASTAVNSQDFETFRSNPQTLIDHLLWQMELARFSDHDRAIATAIIDAVNPDGYLAIPIQEIYQGLLNQMEELEIEEVETVLHRVQNFDPPGIAAKNLTDCLKIQLGQLPNEIMWKDTAIRLVTDFLDNLGSHNHVDLRRSLQLNHQQLTEVVALIRSLNPKPGNSISTLAAQYLIPDLFASKVKRTWQVSLNTESTPRLRVNPYYSGLIKRANNNQDNTLMRNHLQEARWFIKSLKSRSETLLKVARCIVDRQTDFFEHGPIAMKPMILRDVAEEVEMHESTISRVSTQKYMHTPRGIYELKFFFSSHVSTHSGGECSSTAIRAFIQELVNNEPPAKPLSDQKISSKLQDRGIKVARRTIAKYREAMAIRPSNERKRLF